jgi:hypothetical protein
VDKKYVKPLDVSKRGGEPGVRIIPEYMFSVELPKLSEKLGLPEGRLEEWEHSDPIFARFNDHKLPLSNEAYLFPMAKDCWGIKDGERKYEIRKEREKLHIYGPAVTVSASSYRH